MNRGALRRLQLGSGLSPPPSERKRESETRPLHRNSGCWSPCQPRLVLPRMNTCNGNMHNRQWIYIYIYMYVYMYIYILTYMCIPSLRVGYRSNHSSRLHKGVCLTWLELQRSPRRAHRVGSLCAFRKHGNITSPGTHGKHSGHPSPSVIRNC